MYLNNWASTTGLYVKSQMYHHYNQHIVFATVPDLKTKKDFLTMTIVWMDCQLLRISGHADFFEIIGYND